MNIAFIFHSPIIPFRGGVQRVTDVLAKEMVAMGHKVLFLCTKADGEDYADFAAPQEYLGNYENDRNSFLNKYLDLLKANEIEVCLSQEANTESLFLLRNTPKSVKRVSAVHINPYARIGNERRIKRNLHSRNLRVNIFKYLVIAFPAIARRQYIASQRKLYDSILEVSDRLVFLSQHFSDLVAEYQPGIDRSRLAAIGNPNTFAIGDVDFSHKEKLIICVARLMETPKNVHEFIDVWKHLYAKNKDWKALIIGDGPDRGYLEKYAKDAGVERLEFTGSVRNVSEYYSRARIVCMTSIFEGWGMVLTEGMAYGCIPCVYGSYGAAFDIVDDGENGIISTPFKPEEMAGRIQSVIDDEALASRLALGALNKVKNFSARTTAEKWVKLFEELTNE